MGKRIKRYFYNELPSVLPGILGVNANFIMRNGVTIFGKLLRKEGELFLIEDKIPRLHRIEIKNIYEIVVDSRADY